jgi:branched-subunit amino acid transport protein
MSAAWQTVLWLTVATVLIRAAGPVLLGGRELAAPVRAIVTLLAPALLAALVVTQTFGDPEGGITIDERVPAVAAAGPLLAWRPKALLPAIALAGVVAALLRAL